MTTPLADLPQPPRHGPLPQQRHHNDTSSIDKHPPDRREATTMRWHRVALAAGSSQAADEHLTKNLHKFTSVHTSLDWAGFQALQLKRVPANVRRNALLINLNCHNHVESYRRFFLTHILPTTYIRDLPIIADIQRCEERCRYSGGIARHHHPMRRCLPGHARQG
ncbi:uncharacterized protein LACBIDRAFT_307624 [Laccaria bicolor S238N-H82]|uniref:Predicted protein n=1 Tax=Laccaria bicolor (strain S238N-H82 / ATCC MYA-4686) TaxID=486041 RepID=B0DQL5_LACBS|nr:uncharacterized protein LACBIDRAFT_307624 [Laccaria bicolor S238N-H82]EDR03051.1 predicted protein [Laccaria bicolor S238N-H82]|eukprot:XP_001886192.1 predicted protein [Laccaria bicolor S238N-H82]